MDRPSIRRAIPGDAAAIAELSTQLGYPTTGSQSARRLSTVLESDDHAVFVACRADGEIIGWVHVFKAVRIESEPFAELGGIVVDRNHQGLGIGRQLVAATERWSARRGFSKLRVRSRVDRNSAHSFFEHVGFAAHKTQLILDKTIDRP